MIAREELAATQLYPVPATVLAPIAVTRKEEGVGDLTAELARDVNETDEADHGGARQFAPLGSEEAGLVHLEDFGFPVNNKPERPPNGQERQRFERCIQRETTIQSIATLYLRGPLATSYAGLAVLVPSTRTDDTAAPVDTSGFSAGGRGGDYGLPALPYFIQSRSFLQYKRLMVTAA
jgi:hypothetical protein